MSKLEIKFKKILSKAVIPEYQTEGAACVDLVAASVKTDLNKMGLIEQIDTGIAVEIPKGHVGLIFPRSSVTTKTTLMLGNGVGVIDEDYRGTIKFQYRHVNPMFKSTYKEGDRVGQLMVLPLPKLMFVEVDELSDTKRNDSGFGSTGV